MNIGGLKKQLSGLTKALKSAPKEVREELKQEVAKLAKLFQADTFESTPRTRAKPNKYYAGFIPTTSSTKPTTSA